MSGIGDDAASTMMKNGSDILKLLLELVRMREQHLERSKNKQSNTKSNEKIPTLKAGKIDYDDLTDYQNKTGKELQYIDVPVTKLDKIAELAEDYGATFSQVTISDSNVATIAFPPQNAAAMNNIMKAVIQEELANDPTSFNINNNAVAKDDYVIANEVFNSHDIPVSMFNTDDGNIMTAVPKEFNEQFETALAEISQLKQDFKDIDIVNFEALGDFNNMQQVVTELSMTEAQALFDTLNSTDNNLDVKFAYDKDNTINVIYPAENKEKIDNLRNDFLKNKEFTENFKIAVVGNDISLDKKSLLVNENEKEFFMKIPNTKGEQYINLDKSLFSDNGQAIKGTLDSSKTYTILDKNGDFLKEMSGDELAKNFAQNSVFAKNNPTISYADTNSMQRIELYNAKTNTIMKIGLDSSDNIEKILTSNGFTQKAAELMLKAIKTALDTIQAEVFNYDKTSNQIVYEDIPNIDELKNTSALAQQLTTAKAVCVGMDGGVSGSKVCVFDKKANEYCVLPVGSIDRVSETLSENFKGFSPAKCSVIARQAVTDTNYTSQYSDMIENMKSFDTKNAVIQNVEYAELPDGNTFLTHDTGGSFKFVEISKDMPRNEIEKAINTHLGITEAVSTAELMSNLDKIEAIKPPVNAHSKDVSVEMVSSSYCNVKYGVQQLMMNKDNITPESIAKAFNLDEKAAAKLSKSINSTIDKALNSKTGSLSSIMNIAHNIMQTKDSSGLQTEKTERTQSQEVR